VRQTKESKEQKRDTRDRYTIAYGSALFLDRSTKQQPRPFSPQHAHARTKHKRKAEEREEVEGRKIWKCVRVQEEQ
jgi:hypothetical protein